MVGLLIRIAPLHDFYRLKLVPFQPVTKYGSDTGAVVPYHIRCIPFSRLPSTEVWIKTDDDYDLLPQFRSMLWPSSLTYRRDYERKWGESYDASRDDVTYLSSMWREHYPEYFKNRGPNDDYDGY